MCRLLQTKENCIDKDTNLKIEVDQASLSSKGPLMPVLVREDNEFSLETEIEFNNKAPVLTLCVVKYNLDKI